MVLCCTAVAKQSARQIALCTAKVVGPKLLICPPPPLCRYLLEFTSAALAEYPGLGLEVFGMPSQAWITVRLNTCCLGPFLVSQALSHHGAANKCVHHDHVWASYITLKALNLNVMHRGPETAVSSRRSSVHDACKLHPSNGELNSHNPLCRITVPKTMLNAW